MLTERSVGPRVGGRRARRRSPAHPGGRRRAGLRLPARAPASSPTQASRPLRRSRGVPSYSLVDDLIASRPLVVAPTRHRRRRRARAMTERGTSSRAPSVRLADGRYGLVTDALLRRRVLVDGVRAARPSGDRGRRRRRPDGRPRRLGRRGADPAARPGRRLLLVTDRSGGCAASSPRGTSPSPRPRAGSRCTSRSAGPRPSTSCTRTRRVPGGAGDLLVRRPGPGQVIAVYSAILDTIVRRAIELIFERHPELSLDAFTWLVARQQRPARGGAELGRRLRGGVRRRVDAGADRRPTGPRSPRSTRCSRRPG